MRAFSLFVTSLAVVAANPVPHPFSSSSSGATSKPFDTKKLPPFANNPTATGLMQDSNKMHSWWCSIAGNEELLPCQMFKVRQAPNKEERDALQAKLKASGAMDKSAADKRRDAMSKMHEGWCGMAENAETTLCVNWKKSAQRRAETAEKVKDKPPNHASEYVDMHNAYCDEKPENAETSPCLMHRMRYSAKEPEDKKSLQEKMKAITPADRMAQRDEMMNFWCEDPGQKREDSGVCLSWRKRKQMPDLHAAEKIRELGNKHKAPSAQADLNPRITEMEKMHEWYCTQLDGTHDTVVCARWRLRLKNSVEAYDAAAREKDQAFVKEFTVAKGAQLTELQKKLHEAKEAANKEETERLDAELKKARGESQAAFFEMHRRWCEEGAGKDTPDSPACKRWREHMNKAEL